MPISREEFEQGKIHSKEYYVLELFKQNSDSAFSTRELIEILIKQGYNFSEEEVLQVLF